MNDELGDAPLPLTKREREVLTLFLDNDTSKEVADLLCVSKRTVDFHLANAYSKLRVHNRMRALEAAGLVTINQIGAPA